MSNPVLSFFRSVLDRLRAALLSRRKAADPTPQQLLSQDVAGSEHVALANIARSLLLKESIRFESEMRWKRFMRGLIVLAIISGMVLAWVRVLNLDASEVFETRQRLAIVEVQGAITQSSQAAARIGHALRTAAADDRVARIIVHIDSPGGQPAEAERIAASIMAARESKPVDVVAGNTLASAAYLVAIHGERIYAPQHALVGSIGALAQTWDASALLERLRVQQHTIESGPYKSLLNPLAPARGEHRTYVQELVNEQRDLFAQRIKDKREVVLSAPELVSGKVWSGASAKRHGLIDGNATLEEVMARHADLAPRWYGGLTQRSGLAQLVSNLSALSARAIATSP